MSKSSDIQQIEFTIENLEKIKKGEIKGKIYFTYPKALKLLEDNILTYFYEAFKDNETITELSIPEELIFDVQLINQQNLELLFKIFETNKTITKFNPQFSLNHIGLKYLTEFAKNNTTLKDLEIGIAFGIWYSDPNQEKEEREKQLETINLFNTYLKENKTLENLKLFYVGIQSNHAEILIDGLRENKYIKNLTFDEIGGDTKTDLLFVKFLKEKKYQNFLELTIYNDTEYLEEVLQILKKDTEFSLALHFAGDTFHINPDKYLDSEKCKIISAYVSNNTFLKELSFENYLLTDENLQILATGLKNNNSLSSFSISSNDIYNKPTTITEKGLKPILDALNQNNNLSSLYLNDKDFSEEEIKCVINFLENKPRIKAVGLAIRNPNKTNVGFIKAFLQNNTSIISFNMGNSIVNNLELFKEFCEVLKTNKTLTALGIFNSQNTTCEVRKILWEAIKNNDVIQYIDYETGCYPEDIRSQELNKKIEEKLESNRKWALSYSTLVENPYINTHNIFTAKAIEENVEITLQTPSILSNVVYAPVTLVKGVGNLLLGAGNLLLAPVWYFTNNSIEEKYTKNIPVMENNNAINDLNYRVERDKEKTIALTMEESR
ncbi:MAG: hypothetical protein J0H68_07290 [Sphingobacteriia bacterium]|nr:hypothetical protein [Sphingobacteriia bacterium]